LPEEYDRQKVGIVELGQLTRILVLALFKLKLFPDFLTEYNLVWQFVLLVETVVLFLVTYLLIFISKQRLEMHVAWVLFLFCTARSSA